MEHERLYLNTRSQDEIDGIDKIMVWDKEPNITK